MTKTLVDTLIEKKNFDTSLFEHCNEEEKEKVFDFIYRNRFKQPQRLWDVFEHCNEEQKEKLFKYFYNNKYNIQLCWIYKDCSKEQQDEILFRFDKLLSEIRYELFKYVPKNGLESYSDLKLFKDALEIRNSKGKLYVMCPIIERISELLCKANTSVDYMFAIQQHLEQIREVAKVLQKEDGANLKDLIENIKKPSYNLTALLTNIRQNIKNNTLTEEKLNEFLEMYI